MAAYPEEPDPTILVSSNTVESGDKAILFEDKNGGKDILTTGQRIGVGDPIVIHHTKDGDRVTHGKSILGVGDKVILVPTKDGDIVGLKAGSNPYRQCQMVTHYTHSHYEQHDPPDNTWQYASYDIKLDRPLDPYEIVNVRFDFNVLCDTRGVQPWYPCGGVWIGFGPDDENYYWPGGNPYPTIRGQPAVGLGPGGNVTLVGSLTNGGSTWCIPDFLGHLYPHGLAEWNVSYIHIHMSQQSTLAFTNYLRSRLLYTTVCAGSVEEGWCGELVGTQTNSIG